MKHRPVSRGFSLMELLAVIAVIAVLAAVTLPAMNATLQGHRLAQGAQMVSDHLGLARQEAVSGNRVVETRFYSFADSAGSTDRRFSALQNFALQEDGTALPLDRLVRLPQGVFIDSGAALSPLMGASRTKTWTATDSQVALPGVGTAYDARVVRMRPDGSTDLPAAGQPWFLTVHGDRSGTALSTLPKNFATIQLDPWTGRSTVFRP